MRRGPVRGRPVQLTGPSLVSTRSMNPTMRWRASDAAAIGSLRLRNSCGAPGWIGRASGRLPAGGHEQRVVEQWIERAAAEQGSGHAREVGIKRRDVRVAMPLLRGVLRGEESEIWGVDHDALVSPPARARGHRRKPGNIRAIYTRSCPPLRCLNHEGRSTIHWRSRKTFALVFESGDEVVEQLTGWCCWRDRFDPPRD
jgi:hypothetical protein